jgi:hypothetical protein
LLASRDERLDPVTVSVPVSARQQPYGGQLGNQVGVMPVALPAAGGLAARVAQIAPVTRDRNQSAAQPTDRTVHRQPPGAQITGICTSGRRRLLGGPRLQSGRKSIGLYFYTWPPTSRTYYSAALSTFGCPRSAEAATFRLGLRDAVGRGSWRVC